MLPSRFMRHGSAQPVENTPTQFVGEGSRAFPAQGPARGSDPGPGRLQHRPAHPLEHEVQ
jgi:hypothetical protein